MKISQLLFRLEDKVLASWDVRRIQKVKKGTEITILVEEDLALDLSN